MIRYILPAECSKESGQAIADRIARLQGERCLTYRNGKGRFVRYGFLGGDSEDCLNKLEAVRLAANKFGALIAMDEAGVRVPRMFLYHSGPADCPRIFRKLQRYGGRDKPLTVPAGEDPPKEAAEYDYSVEWIRKFEEYRVHVFLGKIIRVQRKVNTVYGPGHPIWSLANGWKLKECDPPFSWLTWLAEKAVSSLGLDFGAVDIIRSTWGGLYVLEVNTAPGILPSGVNKYAQAMHEWDKQCSTKS